MFDILIFISVIAFWIAVIAGPITLFILRLYVSLQSKLNQKELLKVLLMPCSIGYFLTFKEKTPLKKLYHSLVIFFFVLMVIGSILPLYMHLGLNLI